MIYFIKITYKSSLCVKYLLTNKEKNVIILAHKGVYNMKDYSKYIKNEYGFILDIKTNIDEKKIEVVTSKTKKGQPLVYELTKENLEKFYKRLETQYSLLIENKDKVFEDYKKDIKNKFFWIDIVSYTILFVSALYSIVSIIPALVGFVIGSTVLISKYGVQKHNEKQLENQFEAYEFYIENRKAIEELESKDSNITYNVDTRTNNELVDNQALANENLIDSVFDIQLMDKISLKQLREILLRYRITKALEEEQYFYMEEENKEEESKKIRTLFEK